MPKATVNMNEQERAQVPVVSDKQNRPPLDRGGTEATKKKLREKSFKKREHCCIQIASACETFSNEGLPCWCARTDFQS